VFGYDKLALSGFEAERNSEARILFLLNKNKEILNVFLNNLTYRGLSKNILSPNAPTQAVSSFSPLTVLRRESRCA